MERPAPIQPDPVRASAPERAPAHVAERARAMLERLRGSGLKITAQRVAVVHELAADPTHPTAQELFERLRSTRPAVSFATVYNTLDALAAAGLCAAMSLAPGAARFDPNMAPHHHAVCDGCGLVRDVRIEGDAEPVAGALAAAHGFHVRAVERIYRGLCDACARARAHEGAAAAAPKDVGDTPRARGKRRRRSTRGPA
jgi:Fur family peroxide stress response transcriptional regulator